MKRRNFLAVQSNCKKPEEKANGDDMDYKEKARVERKLNGHRQKYLVARTNRAPTWGENLIGLLVSNSRYGIGISIQQENIPVRYARLAWKPYMLPAPVATTRCCFFFGRGIGS